MMYTLKSFHGKGWRVSWNVSFARGTLDIGTGLVEFEE